MKKCYLVEKQIKWNEFTKNKNKRNRKYRWDDPFHNAQGNMQRNIENMVRRPRQLASLQVEMMAYHFPFSTKNKKIIVSVTIGYFYRHM